MKATSPDVQTVGHERDEVGFMRLPEVMKMTGLSRSTIYAMVARGEFPAPVKLGARASGWRVSDVVRWCEARYTLSRSQSFRTAPSPSSTAIQRANRQVVNR